MHPLHTYILTLPIIFKILQTIDFFPLNPSPALCLLIFVYINTSTRILKLQFSCFIDSFDCTDMSDHYPITIPEGLNELLQEFALSVLRKKPEDLVDYAAYYFTDLKEKKQGSSNGVGQMEVSEESNSLLPGMPADPSSLLKGTNGEMDTLPSDGDDDDDDGE